MSKFARSLRGTARSARDAIKSLTRRALATITFAVCPDRALLTADNSPPPQFITRCVEHGHAVDDLSYVSVNDGSVVTDYGVVYDARHRLVAELCINLGGESVKLHPLATSLSRLPPRQTRRGTAVVASSHAHQRYFHWLIDVVPKLQFLAENPVEHDFLIVNDRLPYQIETNDKLVDRKKLIAPDVDFHCSFDRAIGFRKTYAFGQPFLHRIGFLRELFDDRSNPARGRKLYITRADAKTRAVENEHELVEALEKIGFESVQLDGLTIKQQADLFAPADVVVGPHGAGFANIIFAKGKIRVLELFPQHYDSAGFSILSALMGYDYGRMRFDSADSATHNFRVDVQGVLACLNERA